MRLGAANQHPDVTWLPQDADRQGELRTHTDGSLTPVERLSSALTVAIKSGIFLLGVNICQRPILLEILKSSTLDQPN